MLDPRVPCVDDFQLKLPVSSHQRVNTTTSSTLHVSPYQSCALLYPYLVLFDTMSTRINLRFTFGMKIRWLSKYPKNMLTQDILLIIEQVNIILHSPLWIICPKKATEFLSMDSRACSNSLYSTEQRCASHLESFGACFSNGGLRRGHFLIKTFLVGKLNFWHLNFVAF